MASAFIVVLLVATGEAADPSTTLVAKTTQDSLDENAIVVVRELDPNRLTNTEASRVGDALDAGVVVVIAWQDGHRNAVIRVRRDRRRDWVERTLTFVDADPTAERGKTIGFEVAAMIVKRTTDDGRGGEAPPTTGPPQTPTSYVSPRFGIDLLGSGALGHGASGAGGDIAARMWLLDRVGPRLAIGGRFGEASEAGASASVMRVAAGLGVRLLRPSASQPFTFGARTDALVLWYRLSRDTNTSSGSRVVGGVTGVFEGSWEVTRSFAVLVGGGVEVAFGEIDVLVDDRVVSTIRPLRGIVEIGVRWQP
jgi:hypothetical protein